LRRRLLFYGAGFFGRPIMGRQMPARGYSKPFSALLFYFLQSSKSYIKISRIMPFTLGKKAKDYITKHLGKEAATEFIAGLQHQDIHVMGEMNTPPAAAPTHKPKKKKAPKKHA